VIRGVVELLLAAILISLLAVAARALGAWDLAAAYGVDSNFEAPIVAGIMFLLAAWFSANTDLPWKIVSVLYCIGVVVIGAAAGIVARELLLGELASLRVVSAVLTVIFLIIAALWLLAQILDLKLEPPKVVVATFAAFFASFVVALSLVSFFVDDWNRIIGGWLPWASLSSGAVSDVLPGELDSFSDSLDSVFSVLTTVLATAATVYVVVVASPKLQEILKYLELTPAQVKAARKLRRPLSDLIRAVKVEPGFKREFFITADSFERESPIESDALGGARVKIIAPAPGSPPNTFTFAKVRKLLRRAQIDIRESLFFVYPTTGSAAGPICYATGPEMWELMHRIEPGEETSSSETYDEGMPGSGRFRGAFSDSFFGALNSGNAEALIAIIENARKEVLKHNPQDDVLLTSFKLRDSEEVLKALTEMKTYKVRRALVYSGKVPAERAILSIPHIAAYLEDETDG
jgi:hypothetical protein